MHRYLWLIPLFPLLGAAVNGLLGRRLRFAEKTVAAVAVASIALAFALSLGAIYSYAYGDNPVWPAPYVSGAGGEEAARVWIPGGAVRTIDDSGAAAGANLNVRWSYQLDALSSVFLLIVTGVGLCIFIFSAGYMRGDAGFYRFFAYLGLFMFSMLVLVLGSNFLMLFVGWEGVGLCSYLLIGYYFDRRAAGDAARKAFLVNRLGDVGLILGVCAIVGAFGTAEYVEVMSRVTQYPAEAFGAFGLMSLVALGLFVGAVGKSAQIPLFVWLPDAMAGPTPVSALIHAATMVTAGIYLLVRANAILLRSPTMMFVIAAVGAATAVFAAVIALTQTDLKKVLAYSTVSQLGYMTLACGVGAFGAAVFHVTTHAFFKALLFLGAGSVIHAMHHEQDLRRMGNLRKYLPRTYATFVVGWLAICGIFPLSGFWSKDEILWGAASASRIPGGWLWWSVGLLTAVFTAVYMTRLVALVFWGRERFTETNVGGGGQADEAHAHAYDEHLTKHDATAASAGDRPRHQPLDHVGASHPQHGHGRQMPRESPTVMWAPLVALAILSAIGGMVGLSPAFGAPFGDTRPGGKFNINNWLAPVIANSPANVEHRYYNLAESVEHVLGGALIAEWALLLASLAAALLGIGVAWLAYVRRPDLPNALAARWRWLYRASSNKFWVDELYGTLFTRRVTDAARAVYAIDRRIVDGAVNGAAGLVRALSRAVGAADRYVVDGVVNSVALFVGDLSSPLLRAAQTGSLANYALVMVIGVVVVIALFFGADVVATLRGLFASRS